LVQRRRRLPTIIPEFEQFDVCFGSLPCNVLTSTANNRHQEPNTELLSNISHRDDLVCHRHTRITVSCDGRCRLTDRWTERLAKRKPRLGRGLRRTNCELRITTYRRPLPSLSLNMYLMQLL